MLNEPGGEYKKLSKVKYRMLSDIVLHLTSYQTIILPTEINRRAAYLQMQKNLPNTRLSQRSTPV